MLQGVCRLRSPLVLFSQNLSNRLNHYGSMSPLLPSLCLRSTLALQLGRGLSLCLHGVFSPGLVSLFGAPFVSGSLTAIFLETFLEGGNYLCPRLPFDSWR